MTGQLGLLDTNIFVHALFAGDQHRERCLAIVRTLQDGRAEGRIDPLVVHEITYVLLRQRQFPSSDAVRRYVRAILLRCGTVIDLRLIEHSNCDWTEDQVRQLLRPLVYNVGEDRA